jgi:hypothetical protein
MLSNRPAIFTIPVILAVCLAMTGSASQAAGGKGLPSASPRDYQQVVPCDSQVGQLMAPPHAFETFTGNDEPMLGFYQNRLVGMVFYLSETHLYPRLPGGARWGLGGTVNAPVESITIAPATRRPNRETGGYEITVIIHHDPPIEVKCASTSQTTTSQGQGSGNIVNPGGGTTGTPGGSGGGNIFNPGGGTTGTPDGPGGGNIFNPGGTTGPPGGPGRVPPKQPKK